MTEQTLTDYIHKTAQEGTLSHAYILEGSGKNLLLAAQDIAKSLLCEGEKKPCGSCKACKKAEKGIHPDILEVTLKKDRATIGVETIRELGGEVYLLPNEGRKKVYLLHPAEALTEAAQNALLKTIEEPPAHAVFLLLLKEGESLLETVFSRCVRLTVSSLGEQATKKNREAAVGFLKALATGAEYEFIALTGSLPKTREPLIQLVETIRTMFRDILLLKAKAGTDLYFPEEKESLKALCGSFFTKQLVRLSDIAAETVKEIDTNSNIALSGMLFFIKCWEEVH